jgi:hypothetical protein
MTVKEFARRAEISISLAYVILSEEGRVPGVRRIGQKGRRGKYIIPEESLTLFLKSCEVEQESQK